ncbi:hypothetical protein B9T31_02395 [Acinetobacter sp. ANC 4558]|uniref:hypothetical protein n=1 Tax=Acinetobacter sp. ANC 4558 TaxID=1977876 RepID=UPI000A34249A|nr:hypothetical protein [Acinetobacter sp. ANC 4558]OTG88380.1 hypothetical protein B9T31_02395 [Acinetobacter sp. ANC 4558]
MDEFLAFLDTMPEDTIAITAYLVCSFIVLLCWNSIAKRLPQFIGGMSTILLFALILTPTVSDGHNASIAPAIFGLAFGIFTKDSSLIWFNSSLILFVIGVCSFAVFTWRKFLDKNQQKDNVEEKVSPL